MALVPRIFSVKKFNFTRARVILAADHESDIRFAISYHSLIILSLKLLLAFQYYSFTRTSVIFYADQESGIHFVKFYHSLNILSLKSLFSILAPN